MAFGVYGLLLALMAVMKFAPHSDAGRLFNRRLVQQPLELFAKMERHHLIFVLLAVGLLIVGAEVLAMLGSADAALLYALDLSLYLDGVLAALALSSLARGRAGAAALRSGLVSAGTRLRRVFGRRRMRSAVRPSKAPSANDDDHPAMALAA